MSSMNTIEANKIMNDTSDLAKQPALRKWQSKVYDKGPYQIPDYESFAAIVQEHERMAACIEELSAELERTRKENAKGVDEQDVEEKTKINEEWKAACDAVIRSDSWWY